VGAAAAQFVFGYGSLVAGAPMHPARLHGHRRVWGVAMDNSVEIPGYKSYRSSIDGSRPEVFVAFLDIVEDAGATTGGSLIAVDEELLSTLDARERNYDRIEVTEQFSRAPAGASIWASRGSAAGRARLQVGRERGTAVLSLDYVMDVTAMLDVLGFQRDIDVDALPGMYLDRVEIPPTLAS
jgi:hypothetical protein